MKIISHRGYAEDNIENTLRAFKQASEYSDIIELDVRSSKDNIPIVFHDENINRLCGYDIPISKIESNKLNQYTISTSNEFIPKLSTVVSEIDIPILVELKDENIIDKTLEICEKSNNKIIYQSFNPDIIRAIPKEYTRFLLCTPTKFLNKDGISPNSITNIQNGLEFADNENIDGLSIHHSMLNNQINNINYDIFVWTIRSINEFNRVTDYAINGVISDSKKYIQS